MDIAQLKTDIKAALKAKKTPEDDDMFDVDNPVSTMLAMVDIMTEQIIQHIIDNAESSTDVSTTVATGIPVTTAVVLATLVGTGATTAPGVGSATAQKGTIS